MAPGSIEFMLAQARRCGTAAQACGLDNQRETLLRAQRAWQALADRQIATMAARVERTPEVIDDLG